MQGAKRPVQWRSRRRRLRALRELRPGLQVYRPGQEEAGVVVSISKFSRWSSSSCKWCWLRYGANTYVQLRGSAALFALRIEAEDTP